MFRTAFISRIWLLCWLFPYRLLCPYIANTSECRTTLTFISDWLLSFKLLYFLSLIAAFWARVMTCLKVWIFFSPATCFFISLLKRCLRKMLIFTWQVNEVGSTPVAPVTKSVNLWIYSYNISSAAWGLEWIKIAECTFVTTGLNTWHSLFHCFPC